MLFKYLRVPVWFKCSSDLVLFKCSRDVEYLREVECSSVQAFKCSSV